MVHPRLAAASIRRHSKASSSPQMPSLQIRPLPQRPTAWTGSSYRSLYSFTSSTWAKNSSARSFTSSSTKESPLSFTFIKSSSRIQEIIPNFIFPLFYSVHRLFKVNCLPCLCRLINCFQYLCHYHRLFRQYG